MNSVLGLRAERDDDRAFLEDLYSSTRADELSGLGWNAEQLRSFLALQFGAREYQYRDHHAAADFLIVTIDDEPVGRLVVDRNDLDVYVVDIALLPMHRGHGLGSALLREVISAARDDRRTVSLHVDQSNAAVRLYRRLGFEVVEAAGLSWAMTCR